MDFEKLQKEVGALIKSAEPAPAPAKPAATASETPPAAPAGTAPVPAPREGAEKKMTAKEFGEYAQAQVEKAKKEAAGKQPGLAKQRLVALKAESEKIQKFEFRPGELPTVTVYTDPDQLETTEAEIQPKANEPDGQSNYTAKSAEFCRFLEQAIKDLSAEEVTAPGSNRPQERSKDRGEAASAVEWPADLAKSITPTKRDQDKDYDFGADAR